MPELELCDGFCMICSQGGTETFMVGIEYGEAPPNAWVIDVSATIIEEAFVVYVVNTGLAAALG